ncbi:MAG: hypothetical protein COC06_01850 [Bacteroidales bacterium]|nr:MAG: hypothetical protein COC06_01850 [Bacteroidales bacterium]
MKKNDLNKLKGKLKEIPAYRSKLKDRSGYSLSMIDAVLRYDRKNQKIIEEAFLLLKEEQSLFNERKKLLE